MTEKGAGDLRRPPERGVLAQLLRRRLTELLPVADAETLLPLIRVLLFCIPELLFTPMATPFAVAETLPELYWLLPMAALAPDKDAVRDTSSVLLARFPTALATIWLPLTDPDDACMLVPPRVAALAFSAP